MLHDELAVSCVNNLAVNLAAVESAQRCGPPRCVHRFFERVRVLLSAASSQIGCLGHLSQGDGTLANTRHEHFVIHLRVDLVE